MIIIPSSSSQQRKSGHAQVQEAAASAGLILPDVAVLAFQQGRLIEAIKLIRTANPGLDLTRAKAAMLQMQAQAQAAVEDADPDVVAKPLLQPRSQRPPTVAMGDPPGQLRWLFVVVALLVAAAWVGFGGGV